MPNLRKRTALTDSSPQSQSLITKWIKPGNDFTSHVDELSTPLNSKKSVVKKNQNSEKLPKKANLKNTKPRAKKVHVFKKVVNSPQSQNGPNLSKYFEKQKSNEISKKSPSCSDNSSRLQYLNGETSRGSRIRKNGLVIPQNNRRQNNSTKLKTQALTGDTSSMSQQDELILDIQRKSEELERMKFLHEQIKCLVSPTKPHFKGKVIQLNESYETNISRGFKIIDCSKHMEYFSTVTDLYWLGGDIEILQNLSDNVASKYDSIPPLVDPANLLNYWNLKETPSDTFLLFLFRLMTIHEDSAASKNCQKMISQISRSNCVTNPETAWAPTLKDIATVLLNYGVQVEEHCPWADLFLESEKKLTKHLSAKSSFQSHASNHGSRHSKVVSMQSLSLVFGLIEELVHLYKEEELAHIILLLCWLCLDPQAKSIRAQMQSCILMCIRHISEYGWNTKWLIQLCVQLGKLSNNAEDMMTLCLLLAPVEKASDLRKALSFLAVHQCLNVPYTFKVKIRIKDLVSLLRSSPPYRLQPKLLRKSLEFIDFIVGNDIHKKDEVSLDKLSEILRSTFARITDSAEDVGSTQMKNQIVIIRCKWSFLKSTLTSSKAELLIFDEHGTPKKDDGFDSPEKIDQSLPDLSMEERTANSPNVEKIVNQPLDVGGPTPTKYKRRFPELSQIDEIPELQTVTKHYLQEVKRIEIVHPLHVLSRTKKKNVRKFPDLSSDEENSELQVTVTKHHLQKVENIGGDHQLSSNVTKKFKRKLFNSALEMENLELQDSVGITHLPSYKDDLASQLSYTSSKATRHKSQRKIKETSVKH